jgi:peptidoglycan/LPS O-acetylase OafA/YrhL
MSALTTPLRRVAAFWSAPASAPGRGGALDGLRFLASMLIVLFHFGAEGPLKLWWMNDAFARGYLATDFFLMLSGYVLGRAYGPAILSGRVGPGLFWLRRATRIWPGHLVVLAGFVVFVAFMTLLFGTPYNPPQFSPKALVLQALLIHAWGIPGGDGWNLPSWSLSALIVCYAAFPWLWKALARVKVGWLAPLLGLAALAAFDVYCREVFDHPVYDLLYQVGLVRAAPLFLLGVCLARAVELGWPAEIIGRSLFWGGMAVFVILLLLPRHDMAAVLALVAMILGGGRAPVKRSWRWAEQGAKISFALFITHILFGAVYWMLVHNLIFHVKVPLEQQWAMWAASFPLTIGFAWLFHVYVDQPIQRRLAPHLRRREAAPAEVAP